MFTGKKPVWQRCFASAKTFAGGDFTRGIVERSTAVASFLKTTIFSFSNPEKSLKKSLNIPGKIPQVLPDSARLRLVCCIRKL